MAGANEYLYTFNLRASDFSAEARRVFAEAKAEAQRLAATRPNANTAAGRSLDNLQQITGTGGQYGIRDQLKDEIAGIKRAFAAADLIGAKRGEQTKLNTVTNAIANERLASDKAYIEANARRVTSANALRAAESSELAGDQEYLKATAELAVARRRLSANETLAVQNRFLGASPGSTESNLLAREARVAIQKQILAANQTLREQTAIGRLTADQLGTSVGGKTGFNQLMAKAELARSTAAAESAAAIKSAQAADNTAGQRYRNAVADSAIAERERVSGIKQATNTLLTSTRGQTLLNNEARASVQEQIQAAKATIRQQQVISRLSADQLGTPTGGLAGFSKLQATAVVGQETQAAALSAEIDRQKTASSEYTTAVAQSTVAERGRAAAIEAAVNRELETETGQRIRGQEVQNAARLNILQAQRAKEVAEALQLEKADVRILAERAAAEKRLQIAVNQQLKQVIQQTELNRGSLFQRLQAGISARSVGGPRLPEEFQTGGQFLASKALTTAGFAASGALFFGAFTGIRSAFEEATKLQTTMALVKEQFEQAGEAGGRFTQLSDGILEVARNTGIAGSEIAFLALQLRGAFQDEPGRRGSIQFINEQLEAAGKIARVTGLPLAETTDSLTALSKSFGINFGHVGDVALGLQQRFGVLAKEIITFTADLAPVAKEAGLSFDELAGIGAAVQRISGRSGTGLAEALGRILPSIQDNAAPILKVYSQLAPTSDRFAKAQERVLKALSQGKTGVVLKELIRDFTNFNKVQQNSIITALGGRREASTLQALFGDTRALNRELNNAGKGQDVGKLNQQFEKLQGTLSQTLAQLQQTFLQLGNTILNLGVLDFFQQFADVARAALAILGSLVSAAQGLMEVLNFGGDFPWVGKLIELLLLFKGVQFLRGRFGGGNNAGPPAVPSGVVGGRGGGLSGFNAPTPAAGAATGTALGTSIASNVRSYYQKFTGAIASQAKAFAVQDGRTLGQKIASSVGSYSSGLINNIRQGTLTGAQQLGVGALGAAANIAGQKLGGVEGGLVSGLGTFATFSAFGAPEVGAVVGAGQLLESFFSAAEEADARVNELTARYGKLADTRKGRDQLRKISQQENSFTGLDLPGGNTFDIGIGNGPPGPTEQAEAAQNALNRFVAARYRARVRSVLHALDPKSKSARDLIVKLREINQESLGSRADALHDLSDELDREIKKGTINVTKRQVRRGNKIDLAGKGLLSDDAKSAVDLYNNGLISFNSLINDVDETERILVHLVANSKGDQREKYASQLKTIQSSNQFISKQLADQVDLVSKLQGFTGADTTEDDTNRLVALLQNKNFRDPAARATAVGQIYQKLSQALQERIDGAQTAAEKLAIAQTGIHVPDAARLEAIAELVNQFLSIGGAAGVDLSNVADAIGQDSQEIFNSIAQVIDTYGVSVKTATLAVLNEILQGLLNEQTTLLIAFTKLKSAKAIRQQISAINANVGDIAQLTDLIQSIEAGPDVSVPDVSQVVAPASQIADLQHQAAEDTKAAIQARFDYLKALVEGDPIAEASIDIQAADAQAAAATTEAERWSAAAARVRAQKSLSDAANDITKAQFELMQAVANGDPEEIAQIKIQAARFAVDIARGEAERVQAMTALIQAQQEADAALIDAWQANGDVLKAWFADDAVRSAEVAFRQAELAIASAHGEAERLRAVAGQIQAGRTLQEAIFDVGSAQLELLGAFAGAAGDAVTVAALQLQEAQRKLIFGQTHGAGQAELARLQASVTTQQAALRDAQLQEKLSTIDFNLQVEKISKGQAVAQLEALLANADVLHLTEQERRDLILRIRQLRQDLTQDLQFDLPSELRLPTAYESRRIGQLGSFGAYQDNRTYDIQFTSNDQAATQAAIDQLINEINSQPVFGSGPRIY